MSIGNFNYLHYLFLCVNIDFFSSLNDLVLDQFLLFTGERQPDENIIIIGIDDESIHRIGNQELRNQYTKLIQKLLAFGVRTIVFDLLFQDEQNPQIDAQLAGVNDTCYHVIHSFKFSDKLEAEYLQPQDYEKYAIPIQQVNNIHLMTAEYATFPHKSLINSFHQAGFFNAKREANGQVRRIPLFIEYQGLTYPALGLVAILDFFDVSEASLAIKNTFWGRDVVIKSSDRLIRIPINLTAQVLLNFYGGLEAFKFYPLHRIIDLLDRTDEREASSWLHTLLNGKLVIVGNTETSSDEHPIPFTSKFHGVGFHATMISNILKGDYLTETSWQSNIMISMFLSLMLVFAFLYCYYASKSLWRFFSFSIILFIMFNAMAYFLLFKFRWVWLQLLPINSNFILLCIGLIFYDKVIKLKSLYARIHQLEHDIIAKLTALDTLELKIGSQHEQYKVIEYISSELQKILKDPILKQRAYAEDYFLKFLENQEILKDQLLHKLEQLRTEKEMVEIEKVKLEVEKRVYEDLLKGEKRREKAPVTEKPVVGKQQFVLEIMKAFQYFQSQQKRGQLLDSTMFGMVALPLITDKNGEKRPTPMGEILEKINVMREFDSTVLITGEHGTGKELIARAIHHHSRRSNRPLITINCAAIPENLLESELFGHVKGAFTHAITDRKGAFEMADGGTIFLDEIGDLKLDLQAKLLRVLQDHEIQRVGSNKTMHVDIRVITATNKNLNKCVEKEQFRNDLYFRINVVNLHVPPLRERRYDIPFLIQHFLTRFNAQYGKEKSFSDEAIIAAMCYDWPGNVRMLEHTVENVCVMTVDNVITLAALPVEIQAVYHDLFESGEMPVWDQIEEIVRHNKEHLLELSKKALKENKLDELLKSNHLKVDGVRHTNLYDYFKALVIGLSSISPENKRETLVRKSIVDIQDELFHWCHEQKIAKLGQLYDPIEKLLGRSRRQIDNWRKE